jgi:hypothetical protein
MVLQGVCREILQNSGVRLWWVLFQEQLPLPAVFVGVDFFHDPMVWNPKTKKKERRKSCAALIVQVLEGKKKSETRIKLYSNIIFENSVSK